MQFFCIFSCGTLCGGVRLLLQGIFLKRKPMGFRPFFDNFKGFTFWGPVSVCAALKDVKLADFNAKLILLVFCGIDNSTILFFNAGNVACNAVVKAHANVF